MICFSPGGNKHFFADDEPEDVGICICLLPPVAREIEEEFLGALACFSLIVEEATFSFAFLSESNRLEDIFSDLLDFEQGCGCGMPLPVTCQHVEQTLTGFCTAILLRFGNIPLYFPPYGFPTFDGFDLAMRQMSQSQPSC